MSEIRGFQVGDADALVALFDAVLPDFASSSAAGLPEANVFLRDPASFALGAYVDQTPVGLAWGLHMRSPSGRLTTYVHELNVREEWRRRGIGRTLVSEAMAVARTGGSTKFWLSTGGHNEVAQALYDSLGGERKPRGDVNYWWTSTSSWSSNRAARCSTCSTSARSWYELMWESVERSRRLYVPLSEPKVVIDAVNPRDQNLELAMRHLAVAQAEGTSAK